MIDIKYSSFIPERNSAVGTTDLGRCVGNRIDIAGCIILLVQSGYAIISVNSRRCAFRKGDLHLASKVEPLEAVVNELVRAIKARHVARLQAGSCSIEYGFVLDDLLTNYERVCDHCSNVAVAQIEVAQDSFDTHAYLNDLRHGNDTKESEEFHRRLGRYRERYLFPDGQTAEEN